jgi:hypothetical protein
VRVLWGCEIDLPVALVLVARLGGGSEVARPVVSMLC